MPLVIAMFVTGLLIFLMIALRSGLTLQNALDKFDGRPPAYNGEGVIESIGK
jgi:hypothetical protein